MKRILSLFLLISLLLCGCSAAEPVQETYFSMNTVMDLKIWGSDAQDAMTQVKALLSRLEAQWSVTREDSLLSQLNREEDPYLTNEQGHLLHRITELSQRTNGAFQPRMHALSEAWGFYNENHRVPTDAEIAAALEQTQWDLGGALKGYAGQECADLLTALDVDYALLILGGNVQTYGEKPDGSPWQIAIQNPDGGAYLGIVSVTGTASVVTSGDYQRYFEANGVTYHHILDPETGYPADSGLRSVTIICQDGLTADCLSTALFVMGLEEASQFWRDNEDFEAVFVTSEGEIFATEGAILSGCDFEVIHR